ncbi:ABC transporter ATP-binding protein, partial [Pseudomonas sp. JV245A]|nr:ABC transporter ATP-binding protein [Pseudomonas sp. JV245A]
FEFSPARDAIDIAGIWRGDGHSALAQLRSRHLGYVLQTGGLLGFLDVRANISLPRQLLGLADEGIPRRLAERLEIADQLHKKPA